MLPKWVYFVVAAVIALLAFAIAQFKPGLGVPFVALATTIWTGYSVTLQRRQNRSYN